MLEVKERFLGIKPEPRKGLKSGHIEGSKNLPFHLLLNNDRTLKKGGVVEYFQK